MAVTETSAELLTLNTICMRGVVVFPGVSASFEIGRKSSVSALRSAVQEGGLVFLLAQKDASVLEPSAKDMQKIGTVARVTHSLRLSNGNYQVMADGLFRGETKALTVSEDGSFAACVAVRRTEDIPVSPARARIAVRGLISAFTDFLRYIAKPDPDILDRVRSMSRPDELCDYLANEFLVKPEDRQAVLAAIDPIKRTNLLADIFLRETELLDTESEIQQKVRGKLQKAQRDMLIIIKMDL